MKWPGYVLICHVCVVKCFAMTVSELKDFNNFLIQTSRLDENVKSNIPHDDADEDDPVVDHAWETSGKFEGDLILNDKQRRMILTNVAEGLARNGLTDSTKRWPNNEVVYFIQLDHFNSGQMEAIQNGIDVLARASCVKFRPYVKGDRDAVVIQGSRRGCFSQVGYQGGYQVVNLSRRHPAGRGCFRHGTVVHELLHTLGFFHMQSSPDRDDYIDVVWENIIKPARHNFKKYNSFAVSDFGVGYDYDSVLHYSRKAFSSNGQDTIVPKKLGAEIGQRIGLSDKDVQKLNKMYCDADSDLLIEDSSDTPKKSEKIVAAENKVFVGYGLGYEKGKMVIIKLPRAEKKRPQDLPEYPVFDYFSKNAQEIPRAFVDEAEKQIKLYLYGPPPDDKEYIKSYISPFTHDNENLRLIEPPENKNEDEVKNTEKDISSNNEGYTEGDFRSPEEKSDRQPKDDDNIYPRMRLVKESEMNKFNSLLVSPFINDNLKDINNYVINSPVNAELIQKSEDNYLNSAKKNQNKQKEFDERFQSESYGEFEPIIFSEAYQSVPISSGWYGKNNLKTNHGFPFSGSYDSPMRDKEPVGYSYFNKDLPIFQMKYKSGPQKHDSYRVGSVHYR